MKKIFGKTFMRSLVAASALLSFASLSHATPFASCVTNNSGTISFYLNESGAAVTVTYEDGSINTNFNGITTSTNVPAGVTNFSLAGHTSYSISVTKNGSGTPSMIASHAISSTGGVAVNTIPTSPYFGHIYDVQRQAGVWLLNSDLSLVKSTVQTAGVGFPVGAGSSSYPSPDWVAVAPDGTVLVTDESLPASAVYQMAPDFSSYQLFLGPLGATNTAHGSIISPVILNGSITNGNAQLITVDGDLGNPGSIQVYNIGSGPLPWTNAPSYQGPQISIAGYTVQALGANEYIGMTEGPNGYIYASTYRGGTGGANFMTVIDATGTNVLWSSEGLDGYPDPSGTPPTGDWFYQTALPAGPIGISGSAVSPDGKYLVGLAVQSYFVVCPLTNGIPNTAAIFTINAGALSGSSTENGRGISWDAADNIVESSSGLLTVSTWSLGTTATAITTGNASGTTGFSLTAPSTSVSVVATTPNASQGGSNGTVGTPVPGVFTITRTSTNGYASAQTVNFTLTGTAPSGAYTTTATGSVVIPAGQQSVNVTITPTTANVPRATTTVILSVTGGAGYTVAAPFTDTVYIQNTSSQLLQASVTASSMYKAYSNDFASFTLTRLGDTNAASYTVSSFTYAGTAVAGTDYTLPTPVTFNPGDLTHLVTISPLVGGQPPVDTSNPTYVGNLTATITTVATGSYGVTNGTVTLTSIDNATPPATVIWSSALTNVNEATNWVLTYAAGNIPTDGTNGEYEVVFGYDLTANNPNYGFNGQANGVIGYPPTGASNVLRVTVNKAAATVGSAGGVNLFPITGTNFSGNYAVRFYMNIVQGEDNSKMTEGPIFGINHGKLGYATNWFDGSGIIGYPPGYTNWTSDGIWFWVDGQAGGWATFSDFTILTSVSNAFPNSGWQILNTASGSTFANNFKAPIPFDEDPAYGVAGIPSNESPNASYNTNSVPANVWSDVEIKQINNVVTMSINKIAIFTYTNTTIWTNGVPMLGYDDPFSSVQSEDSAAYFSDIRVVSLTAPSITGISLSGTNVVINFTTSDGDDTSSSFVLLDSGTNSVAHVDTTNTTATFTQLGTGAFQAVTSKGTNTTQFYRIKHK